MYMYMYVCHCGIEDVVEVERKEEGLCTIGK